MSSEQINPQLVQESNSRLRPKHFRDLEALTGMLARRGVAIEPIMPRAAKIEVALPSWGFCQSGTRFGRFPIAGEPRDIYEKMTDAAAVHQLTGITPRVSLHIPWDRPDDP